MIDINAISNDLILSLKAPKEAAKRKVAMAEGARVVALAGILMGVFVAVSTGNWDALISTPIGSLVFWVLGTGFFWVIARILGGKGKFGEFAGAWAYPYSAIGVITGFITALVLIMPFLGALGMINTVLSLYMLYILYIYLMQVMGLSSVKAIITVLIPIIILAIIAAIAAALFIALVGTAIGSGALEGLAVTA